MGTIIDVINEYKLSAGSFVNLNFQDYAEIWHVSDSYISDAIAETATAGVLADLLATSTVTVFTHNEENFLEQMRQCDLLEHYEHDFTFADYLAEALKTSGYEYGLLDITTERYDHKRGRCDVSVEVKVPVEEVLALGPEADDLFTPWTVWVTTKNGKLILE